MPYRYTSQSHIDSTQGGTVAEDGCYPTHSEEQTYASTWDSQYDPQPSHWTYVVDTNDDYAEAHTTKPKKKRSSTRRKHGDPRQATLDLPSTAHPTAFETRAQGRNMRPLEKTRGQSSVPRSMPSEQYLTEDNLRVLQCDLDEEQWPTYSRDGPRSAAWMAAEQWQWQEQEKDQFVVELNEVRAR